MPESKTLLIGITGTIGSGKSSFCRYIEEAGYEVLYADEAAHRHLHAQTDLFVKRWGDRVLEKGELHPAKISQIVFNNAEELKWLNAQIHPRVLTEFQRQAEACSAPLLFFEIPLLFEAGLQDAFDYIISIQADRASVMQRVQDRDGSSREDIQKRLDKQLPAQKKAELADRVILNNGTLRDLQMSAEALLRDLKSLKARPKTPFI